MERIIVFSSKDDERGRFGEAVGATWSEFGFTQGTKHIIFSSGYMDPGKAATFDLLLVCEPGRDDEIDDDVLLRYEKFLDGIESNITIFIDSGDQLYVFIHNHTDEKLKTIQQEFVQKLPGNYIPVDEYSHSDQDSRYPALAKVMEAARNPNLRNEYQYRLDTFRATLSFPVLYDLASSLQMRLFLQYCKSQYETRGVDPVDLADLPKLYREFAVAARIHNPDLDEIFIDSEDGGAVPQSLQMLCSNDLERKAMRENMDAFGNHLNRMLISVFRT